MKASGMGSLLSSGSVKAMEGLFRRRNFAFRFEDLYEDYFAAGRTCVLVVVVVWRNSGRVE